MSSDIPAAKRLFQLSAQSVCPGFRFHAHLQQTYNDLLLWCLMLPGNLDPARGLLIYGNNGTGKTTMLQIVRHFAGKVRPRKPDGYPYSFLIKPALEICAEYQPEKTGGEPALRPYTNSRYLAIDDLGKEPIPTVRFGMAENLMERLLYSRYDRRFTHTTHITTNLDIQQIADIYGDGVYDRCKEMFNFVPFMGKTNRHAYNQ